LFDGLQSSLGACVGQRRMFLHGRGRCIVWGRVLLEAALRLGQCIRIAWNLLVLFVQHFAQFLA
jgi:hypothetical protein